MALPKVSTPTYELKIPSTGKKVSYRPFLVKEEKTLLTAMESGDQTTMTKAMQDIISSCTEGEVKVKELAPFDLEYFFLQLRGKSVGDKIQIKLKKPESIDCEEKNCGQLCEVNLDVSEITVDSSTVNDGKINITEDIGIKLKYPELDSMQKYITGGEPTADEVFKLITESIEYIWEGEEIF